MLDNQLKKPAKLRESILSIVVMLALIYAIYMNLYTPKKEGNIAISIQIAAVIAGLDVWLGLPWLLAIILAFFVGGIPGIGTVVGMFGAVDGWGWSWTQAGLLFFGPLVLIFAIGAIASIADRR